MAYLWICRLKLALVLVVVRRPETAKGKRLRGERGLLEDLAAALLVHVRADTQLGQPHAVEDEVVEVPRLTDGVGGVSDLHGTKPSQRAVQQSRDEHGTYRGAHGTEEGEGNHRRHTGHTWRRSKSQ